MDLHKHVSQKLKVFFLLSREVSLVNVTQRQFAQLWSLLVKLTGSKDQSKAG